MEQHAKVLAFACGSARLPAAGFTAMQPPFTVTVHEGEPTNHLPSAHTCMNNLCFPLYESKESFSDFYCRSSTFPPALAFYK